MPDCTAWYQSGIHHTSHPAASIAVGGKPMMLRFPNDYVGVCATRSFLRPPTEQP